MAEPQVRRRSRAVNVEPTQEEVQAATSQGATVHEGTVFVQRVAYGVTEEEREVIPVPLFHTAPGRVRVVAGATRNLGDYNSARVEVAIEVPCYPEEGEYRRAYEFAAALLDEYIPIELEKAGVPVERPEDTHVG